MNFVFFGYDFSLSTLKALLKEGHKMTALYTFPCDGIYNSNENIIKLANKHDIPVQSAPITAKDIDTILNTHDIDFFLCCGYPYKIPPIDETRALGLNVHPTYLPRARGLMPTPTIIMTEPEAGGFTVHKLAPQFDAGDILYQERITITARTNVDAYSTQVANNCAKAIPNIVKDLDLFWESAQPQNEDEATTAPTPTDQTRTLHWHNDVQTLDRTLRAFGSYGCYAHINGVPYGIFAHKMEMGDHDHAPGTITDIGKHTHTIAAGSQRGEQGFITLTKFQRL